MSISMPITEIDETSQQVVPRCDFINALDQELLESSDWVPVLVEDERDGTDVSRQQILLQLDQLRVTILRWDNQAQWRSQLKDCNRELATCRIELAEKDRLLNDKTGVVELVQRQLQSLQADLGHVKEATVLEKNQYTEQLNYLWDKWAEEKKKVHDSQAHQLKQKE